MQATKRIKLREICRRHKKGEYSHAGDRIQMERAMQGTKKLRAAQATKKYAKRAMQATERFF